MKKQEEDGRARRQAEAREAKNLEAEIVLKKIEQEEKLQKEMQALANRQQEEAKLARRSQ